MPNIRQSGGIKGTFVRASSERIYIRFSVDMMILFANSWCSNIRFDAVNEIRYKSETNEIEKRNNSQNTVIRVILRLA